MSFRQWLRELLAQGRYPSQYRMAKEFRVSEAAVTLWLKGEHRPGLESCAKISEATGKPLADIWELVRMDDRTDQAA